MLQSVKIQKRQSEIRQSLAGLVANDAPSDDETRQIETLDAEYRSNEIRFRAALTSEDEQRHEAGAELEGRSADEWSRLVSQFELRQAAAFLDEGRPLHGATAEIVEELRSQHGFQGVPIPYAALMETRAGETIAADVPAPRVVRPIIGRLFPASVAAKLGGEVINIPQGEVAFPVATSGAVVEWQATELGDVGGPNPYVTSERILAPDHTAGAQMVISRKALKQSGQGLEEAIRRDLNASISAELDRVVINGTGTLGEPLGIIPGAAVYGIESTPVGAAATWSAIRAEIVAFMEANEISAADMVKLGIPPAIWADLDDALISGTAVSQLDRLSNNVGNPILSNNIPDATAILTTKTNGVAPFYVGIWGAVDLIRDPYTKARSGQLVLTGLVTADVTAARGSQIRLLTGLAE